MPTKYFLYARKSTEDEEKQIMSIEAQLAELAEFAKREGIEITEQFIESKSAKKPGRKIFSQMIQKIYDSKEPVGIISWHPDRLARNSIDGGQIIYLIDIGKVVSLRFPCFWFEPTPQGLFMLQVAFGQSKYYSDNLSENVKRGIRQKLRRGECGAAITAQFAKGNGGICRYYRCTKRLKHCSQEYIAENELIKQLKEQLQTVTLSDEWADKMLAQIAQWKTEENDAQEQYAQNLDKKIQGVENKLDKLVNAFLDDNIEKEIYLKKKNELIKQKTGLHEQKSNFGRRGFKWNEPLRQFILSAHHAKKVAASNNLMEIKSLVEKIGTNRRLLDKKAAWM